MIIYIVYLLLLIEIEAKYEDKEGTCTYLKTSRFVTVIDNVGDCVGV